MAATMERAPSTGAVVQWHCLKYRALRATCDAAGQQQTQKKAETYRHRFLWARRNEAGGSIGLAPWIFPGATTSQMRGAQPLEK